MVNFEANGGRKEADCDVIPQNERRGEIRVERTRKISTRENTQQRQNDRGNFVVKVVQTYRGFQGQA